MPTIEQEALYRPEQRDGESNGEVTTLLEVGSVTEERQQRELDIQKVLD